MLPRGVKSHQLPCGRWLHFWYANNRGNERGYNTTIVLAATETRAPRSASQPEVIKRTKTGNYAGVVNLSKRVLGELGL